MELYEVPAQIAVVVSFIVNLVVARACFALWTDHKVAAFLLLGISAILAVLSLLAQVVAPRIDCAMNVSLIFWTSIDILWIVDMILYGLGITALVRHYSNREATAKSPAVRS